MPLASSFCTRVMRFPMRVASLVCPADVAVASRACALVTHAAALASRALILGTRAKALVQSTVCVLGVAGVLGVARRSDPDGAEGHGPRQCAYGDEFAKHAVLLHVIPMPAPLGGTPLFSVPQ